MANRLKLATINELHITDRAKGRAVFEGKGPDNPVILYVTSDPDADDPNVAPWQKIELNDDDVTSLREWCNKIEKSRLPEPPAGAPCTPRLDRRTELHTTDHLRTLPDGRVLFFDHEVRGNTMFVFQVLAELHDVDSAKKMYDVMENWEPEDVE